jgi:hypothetical protein
MKRSWAARGFRTFCFLTLGAGVGSPQLLFAADGPAAAGASADADSSLETVQITADKLHVLPTQPNE